MNRWTQLEPSGASPPARYGHSSTLFGERGGFGRNRQRMLVFGGQNQNILGDTWELNVAGSGHKSFNLTCDGTNGDMSISINSDILTLSATDTIATVRSRVQAAKDVEVATITSEHDTLCSGDGNGASLFVSFYSADGLPDKFSTISLVGSSVTKLLPGGNGTYANSTVVVGLAADSMGWAWNPVTQRSNGPQPSPRTRHSAAVFITDGMQHLFIYGGWDGNSVLNDIWSLLPDESGFAGMWKQIKTVESNYLRCRPTLLYYRWYGVTCSNISQDEAPRRYGHATVPLATSITNDKQITDGLFTFGGTGQRLLGRGTDHDEYGWWTGGSNPDSFTICTDSKDYFCKGATFKSRANGYKPQLFTLMLVPLLHQVGVWVW